MQYYLYIDSPCECEHNNPDSLDARPFLSVVLAVAPSVTMDEVYSLSISTYVIYIYTSIYICTYLSIYLPATAYPGKLTPISMRSTRASTRTASGFAVTYAMLYTYTHTYLRYIYKYIHIHIYTYLSIYLPATASLGRLTPTSMGPTRASTRTVSGSVATYAMLFIYNIYKCIHIHAYICIHICNL